MHYGRKGCPAVFRFEKVPVVIGGEEHIFYVLPHPGAVAIVAMEEDRIVLIRQLRPAVGRHMLEIPAGILEPNEDPQVAAARELGEETGLRAGRLERLGGIYSAPGYSSEYLHIYLATDLTAGPTNFDAGEEILDILWLGVEEVEDRIAAGEIEDGKTIAAVFFLRRHLESENA